MVGVTFADFLKNKGYKTKEYYKSVKENGLDKDVLFIEINGEEIEYANILGSRYAELYKKYTFSLNKRTF